MLIFQLFYQPLIGFHRSGYIAVLYMFCLGFVFGLDVTFRYGRHASAAFNI